MIPKIAIHGREKQSNLVIEYLEKLGGRNENNWIGDDTQGYYWIDDINRIRCTDNIPEGYKLVDIWHKLTETKYILVHWPESQHFIGIENCYYINPMDNINLDQAMFVPENVYNKIMNNEI